MRACLLRAFGSPEELRLEEIPDPIPGETEVLVEVRAAGVTYAELLVIQGKYQVLPKLPFVPGKELAGVVLAVGDGVKSLRPGDRVLGLAPLGAYADKASIEESRCFALPAGVPFADAAAMGIAYQAAYFALFERGTYKQGESVLVNGASGAVGLAAVQLARASGARVLAGITTPDKASLVRAAGADHVIDLLAADLDVELRKQVQAANAGRGVDIVIDMLGGDVFSASLRALAWRGRIVIVGFAAQRSMPSIPANYLLIKNITATGLFWNSMFEHVPGEVRTAQRRLFGWYEAGRIKPTIMEALPLHEVRRAFSCIARREARGRLVLTPVC
ncbi:MAG: NADPH:quinone oxidoreductase family protein [Betaproteobacteria bacterium]|nr:NADPH:quinone oxidoreductase family protein [Betaproteobacteria bacterium]MBI3939007.1 NADPH:quinone oxidoreductase family protein [Betaproteobacteria bacterium]